MRTDAINWFAFSELCRSLQDGGKTPLTKNPVLRHFLGSVRQGALNPDRSEGTWHGAFPTYEKARRTAAVMSPQKRAQLNCRLCHPQDF
jgi:hypothetical protein